MGEINRIIELQIFCPHDIDILDSGISLSRCHSVCSRLLAVLCCAVMSCSCVEMGAVHTHLLRSSQS